MKNLSINLCIILALSFISIKPQEQDSLIEIYPGIGYSMDFDEMNETGLLNLKRFSTFVEAKYFLRNDSLLVVKIAYLDESGNTKDSLLIYEASMVGNIRASIRQRNLDKTQNLDQYQQVTVITNSGDHYYCVIEYVDQNNLTILNKELDYTSSARLETKRITLLKADLNKVMISGESYVMNGLLIGTLTGFLTGAIIGYADGDDPPSQWLFHMTAGEKAIFGGAALGAIGMLTGLVVGFASSTFDEEILITEEYNLIELNAYAMYK
jgi:hypothetical protein